MLMRLQHQRPDGEIDTYHLKPGRRYHIGRGSACEVRILDLKLSRKHCAVEFANGRWQIVDLLSTNGCKLDGEQIVGTVPLVHGAHIEAGQTTLTVADLAGQTAAPVPPSAAPVHEEEAAASDHTVTTSPGPEMVQEDLPDGDGDAQGEQRDDDDNTWEPEPGSEALNKTDALIPNRPSEPAPARIPVYPPPAARAPGSDQVRRPGAEARRPTAVFRSEDQRLDHHDGEETKPHSPSPALEARAPAIPPNPASLERQPTDAIPATDRTFYITVLGRRVGPLTRAAARELKARELKGTLTTADLEGYPLG